MGKHAKPSGKSVFDAPGGMVRARPLPVRSAVRLRRPVDIWHKPALSAVAALAIPDLTLWALGRLDLILYTSAGAMCALYAHGLPYAARARTLAWVVLGMVASLGIALTAASLITSTALLVVCASLVAAVHKVVCEATRIGPPGNIILTFIAASAFFVPQHPGQVPLHIALALGAGVLAWLVCMAPALIRPQGPERIVVARALEAAAGLLRTEAEADGGQPAEVPHARHATAAAVNAAWHTLFLVPVRTPARAAARAGLERLLVRAESALGDTGPAIEASAEAEPRDARFAKAEPRDTRSAEPEQRHTRTTGPEPRHTRSAEPEPRDARFAKAEPRHTQFAEAEPHHPRSAGPEPRHTRSAEPDPSDTRPAASKAEADRLGGWARELRSGRPLPEVVLSAAQAEELAGVAAEEPGARRPGSPRPGPRRSGPRRPAPGHPRGVRAVLVRLAPGSPLLPIGARVAAGCVLAGWASMAVGVGHPYWAVVTAASIYQANTTLSWQRALQRTLGNLLGLLLYTALLPLMHLGPLAMIALALACQLGAEAGITRNYWLGSVCVTPMALLLTEFGSPVAATTLIADRWIDTVVGAAVGLACCVLVTNRRAADRIEVALGRVAAAEAVAFGLLAAGPTPGADEARDIGWARDRLAGCLVELREAVEVAAGEWWQRPLPEERIAHAEQRGHRALAGLVRRLSAPALAA
ncbi:FUSC family protein [Streptomyces nigrescens]|uniref:FUSC family protein n=1 Tax=Streptomyces nigrescens TaxID=1920 RepID=UPI0022554480|nr:FUSC family protein [Streptomyces libani]MCX5447650.1 FUSC family protein [Streptomyces libani]